MSATGTISLEEAGVLHEALLTERRLAAFNATCLHASASERSDALRKLAVIDGLLHRPRLETAVRV